MITVLQHLCQVFSSIRAGQEQPADKEAEAHAGHTADMWTLPLPSLQGAQDPVGFREGSLDRQMFCGAGAEIAPRALSMLGFH